MKSRVSEITIGRLFNSGNYEHIRFEIKVQVAEGESAADALIGVERILSGLKPKCPVDDAWLSDWKRKASWTDEEWKRYEGETRWADEKLLNATKLAEAEAKIRQWKQRQEKVRLLLDDLGAASKYKDAKLDWDDDNDDY